MAKEKKALRKSLMNEIKKSQPQIVERDPLDIEHVFEQRTQQPTQPAKSFTNNSMLNEMLNETAQGGEWRSINSNGVGGGMFNSSQAIIWWWYDESTTTSFTNEKVVPYLLNNYNKLKQVKQW